MNGAVNGGGIGLINNGVLDFTQAFSENVTFAGSKGTLELAQSQGYAGTITGFSKTGGTVFDLLDIGFVSSGEAVFVGKKKAGTLTVSDGTDTATIKIAGSYKGVIWTASSDGHNGTLVTASTPGAKPPPALPAAAAFAGAMAAMGAPDVSGSEKPSTSRPQFSTPAALIAAPRVAMA